MKTTQVIATLIAAATLPLTAIPAEETGHPKTTAQKHEQSCGMMGMQGVMMSNWKDQDAELNQLVVEMNSAPADKKLDAVAAVLTKLVAQRKAMHEHMQADEKKGMGMCRMMMSMDKESDRDRDHARHH